MAKKINPKDEKINELTLDLQRIQADFVNYKARAEKERIDSIGLGKESVIEEFLPVLDSLYRAFDHAPENIMEDSWVKGIMGLKKQLDSSLASLGLERIETVGKSFDPETMEAVSAEEGDGEEIVTAEIRPGYRYSGKVIRPSLVQVKK